MNGPNIRTGNIDAQGNVILGHNNHITNIYLSADWQGLKSQHDTLLARIRKYPEDTDFQRELAVVLREMEDFKRDVLKLAEDFQRIPLNTERLQRAQQYFQAGDYAAARAVLDAEAMGKEQDALLARQQQLAAEQTDIQANLDAKANEFLLLAKLTAVEYSLGDQRIARTCGYFEQVLKSGRTPERLLPYAKFLQENNQCHPAETLYREALTRYHSAAADNPAVYPPDAAIILNNLAILVAQDRGRVSEAEDLYTKALALHFTRVADNPVVYLSEIAATLNNLANLVAKESGRHKEAEALYCEALTLCRTLSADNPAILRLEVATTLNNMASLVAQDIWRRSDAEAFYTEALEIYRDLSAEYPEVYRSDMAMTLNNLANLCAYESIWHGEAEVLYTEALTLYLALATDNPAVYRPDVAMTLNNLALLVANDSGRRSEAETLFTEALTIFRALCADNPTVYVSDVANTLAGFGQARLTWGEPEKAKGLLEEADELIKPLAQQHPGLFEPLWSVITALLGELGKAPHP